MMTAEINVLWVDQATRRVVHFSPLEQPVPSQVIHVTAKGVVTHVIEHLERHVVDTQLPPAMLPQVCWLYQFENGALRLATGMA